MNQPDRTAITLGDILAMPCLLAACLLGFCDPSRAEECTPPRLENTVRMEFLGNQGVMVVPISLNGVEKKFLFDTGGGRVEVEGDLREGDRVVVPSP